MWLCRLVFGVVVVVVMEAYGDDNDDFSGNNRNGDELIDVL